MKKDLNYDALLEKVPNKYVLTIIAGERARDIAKERANHSGEMRSLTKYDKKDTDVKRVFREIVDGCIGYDESK